MNNHLEFESGLRSLLKGMLFTRFCFETRFSLYFVFEMNGETEDNGFPGAVRILLSDWWFGDRDEWELQTKGDWKMEEPLLGVRLVKLRWSGNPVVSDVKLSKSKVSIFFETGEIIHSTLPADGDEFFLRIDEIGGDTWFEATGYDFYLKDPKVL